METLGNIDLVPPERRVSGLASHAVQGTHYDYHWNGTRVDLFREPAKGEVYRIV
jgi:hypothetical protein